jgi:hypothetical protein
LWCNGDFQDVSLKIEKTDFLGEFGSEPTWSLIPDYLWESRRSLEHALAEDVTAILPRVPTRIEARSASEWAGSAFPLAGASGLNNPG